MENRDESIQDLRSFYAYYLSQHQHPACRWLHVAGSLAALASLVQGLLTQSWIFALAAPLLGYGLAWTGHFVFEKNKPATFRYPVKSFLCDWIMLFQMVTGRLKLGKPNGRRTSQSS